MTDTGNSLPLPGRIWGVFINPRATFTALSQSIGVLDVVVPFLLLLAISLTSQVIVGPLALEEQQERVFRSETIPDEQKDVLLDRMEASMNRPWRYVIGGVAAAVWFAVLTGVVMFFGAFIMGGQATFVETLTVVLYANLVGVAESALKIPLMLQMGTTRVETGLALLLPGSLDGTLIQRFFQRLDIFTVWKILLVSIGVAVIYRVDEKKARTLLLTAWVLLMFLLAWLLDGRGMGT